MKNIPSHMMLVTVVFLSGLLAPDASARQRAIQPERPDDPPAPTANLGTSPPGTVTFGPYTSVQVNVDGNGMNVLGDAANETSIAVDPTDPSVMAIGWRQFDNVVSNFRQAGWAYTSDAGQSWTFPGTLEPGVFRSDPVLDSDSQGNLYYLSLYYVDPVFRCDMYISSDGGASWSGPNAAFGGDKA